VKESGLELPLPWPMSQQEKSLTEKRKVSGC